MKTCNVDGCDNPFFGKGYCQKHYKQIRRNGHTGVLGRATCNVDGCDQPVVGKGLCRKHYTQKRRTGSPVRVNQSTDGLCSVADCRTPIKAKGLCLKHYKQDYRERNGRKLYGKRKKPD